MPRPASLLILFALVFAFASDVAVAAPRRHPAYSLMTAAAEHQKLAQQVLYGRKLALGLFDSALDPNRTGLVGVEYSSITTTLGSLKAKRTTTNPDFAAYVVRVLVDHGIGAGDSVLVTMTGSFPGLNLAVIVALETLNVSSLRVVSLGSSSYGANQEDFTWLEMEDALYTDGMIFYRSNFVTLGGTGDVGGGLPLESKTLLHKKADSLGYHFLKTRSFKRQSALRREQLGLPRGYAVLINIGGNQVMLGKGKQGRELPGGWIDPASDAWRIEADTEPDGIVFDFLAAGVPVLNLLHIEEIARTSGLPYDPVPLPMPGQSHVYFLNGSPTTEP